jgi:hypothetical protein
LEIQREITAEDIQVNQIGYILFNDFYGIRYSVKHGLAECVDFGDPDE